MCLGTIRSFFFVSPVFLLILGWPNAAGAGQYFNNTQSYHQCTNSFPFVFHCSFCVPEPLMVKYTHLLDIFACQFLHIKIFVTLHRL